jgi:photosystem II stability/assembly factor-like uncharacterized protein
LKLQKAILVKTLVWFFLIVIVAPCFSQWKNIAPNAIAPSFFRMHAAGGILTHYKGILWAAGEDLWISMDTGRTWTRRSPNTFSTIRDISCFDENTILVATAADGIYQSFDQGITWKQVIAPVLYIQAVAFLGAPHVFCFSDHGVNVTRNGGLSYTQTLASEFTPDLYSAKGGSIYTISGNRLGSSLYVSRDAGATWQQSPGLFDWDSFSFDGDVCDTMRFYIANEDVATPTDNRSCMYYTSNGGITWGLHSAHTIPHYCGSVSAASSSVYAQTFTGIERSTDDGMTWVPIGGPSNIVDTRYVTAVNDNVIVAIDAQGSVWRTDNSGGDSLGTTFSGNLVVQPHTLFSTDTSFCFTPIIRGFSIQQLGCSPPDLKQTAIGGSDAAAYVIDRMTSDSVYIKFVPSRAGDHRAFVVCSNSDGSVDTVLVQGFGSGLVPLVLTSTNIKTDTLGDDVEIPIVIHGLISLSDIEFVLHYDTDLMYLKSYSTQNISWIATDDVSRRRVSIRASNVSGSDTIGFVCFTVYADSGRDLRVTFDSLQVLTPTNACYSFQGPSLALVTPPSGCGVQILSDFMHYGRFPSFNIYPNPAENNISLFFKEEFSSLSIRITDLTGRLVFATSGSMDGTVRINTSKFAEGLYLVTVQTSVGVLRRSFVVRK